MQEQFEPLGPLQRRKRAAIIDAAVESFLGHGFEATRMDRLAARAGVSKRTLYNHFASKEALFAAVVKHLYEELLAPGQIEPVEDLAPVEGLRVFARRLLAHLRSPRVLALLKLVVAEHTRFPSLTSLFYQHGKQPALRQLTAMLRHWQASGQLRCEEPELAAVQFLGLVKEGLFWPLLLGSQPPREDETTIEAAVRAFLRLYG